MTTTTTVTKSQQAQQIFTEVNGVRADFIKRVMTELGMSKAGSSTYFQNCKTRANGQKVKHYYKPVSERNVTKPVDIVDDSKEEADVFEVELTDGSIKCFLSQQELDDFVKSNQDTIKQ